jgi:hypothetical protein
MALIVASSDSEKSGSLSKASLAATAKIAASSKLRRTK